MPADAPFDYEPINEQLDSGDLEAARSALDSVPAADERYTVLRLKLALLDGTMPPGAVMQQLIQLMRRHTDWPNARELYQVASRMAYSSHESSTAHSHPPPPTERR